MGNLKRFLAMTLTMLMVVGCFAMSGSVAAFDDVVDYQQQINLMTVLKIIEGYSADEFGPDNDVERWHMALWIAKIMTGKVEDAYVNWYSTQNNTAFADIEVDHFFGSISYCNENGVVIGTSATTFEPAKGIMIQDVFTMVVRMLGYGSASMDANYPWSYVDKAIQLGLDYDLAADYNNEDVATREQAAVILYNALFAKKADGTTYAASKFNLTMDTIVLTGTSKANMFSSGDVEAKKLAGENYVAFNQLNADGTMGSETFYLLKSWFGFDDETDENLYFGQSYKVITKDNYTTLIYCEAIEGYWVDQTEFDGVKDSKDALKIEGKSYKAVKSYSYLNYEQGKKTSDNLEIIGFDTFNRPVVNDVTSYIMDADRNILKDDGKTVALYYKPGPTSTASSWKDDYKEQVTINNEKVFVTPSQATWDNLAVHVHAKHDGSMSMIGSDLTSHDLFNRNAYSDTVLYDDNADGIYDRAMYTYYKFGFISYNDDKHITIDGTKIFGDTKYDDAGITYVTADGEKLEAADVMKALDSNLSKGNYILYTYNKWNKYVVIKEFFTPNQGLVTSIDKPNGTITFDQVYYNISSGNVSGTKFNVGNAKLPGATKNEAIAKIPGGDLDQLMGRNVHYIEKDGSVLAIYEAYNNGGKYLVFDSVVGINSTGYVNALVYNNNNTRTVVTIASVEGDWYGYANYKYTSNADWLNQYGFGELFSYTTDALGNFHIKWINPETDYTYYYSAKTGTFFENVSMKFINGIAIPVINNRDVDGIAEYKFFENADGVAKAFTQFNTNADTVIVIMNAANHTLNAFKGIPVTGAEIEIYRAGVDSDSMVAKIFVDQTNEKDKASIAKFIYINAARFDRFAVTQAWNYLSNDTVIFIDDTAAATEIMTNQTNSGYGVTLGTVYSYNKTIDFVNGGVKNDVLVYNNRLTKGNFYAVKDAYVEGLLDKKSSSEIGVAYLQYIDTYEAVWLKEGFTLADRTNYRTNFLYQLKGTDIVDVSADDSSPKNMIWDQKANINKDGAFAPAYYYAGSLNSPANVFIYETITAGISSTKMYTRYDWITTEDIITTRGFRPFGREVILENYSFQPASKALTPYNWFEISKEDYDSISAAGFIDNDAFNRVVNMAGISMMLYDAAGNVVPGFKYDNVLSFTEIAYTNGGGYKYFLVFTSFPSWGNTSVGGSITAKYTLRWAEGITNKSMELTGFGLAKADYAYLFDNQMFTYPNFNAYLADPQKVELTANFFDAKKPENIFFNYEAILDFFGASVVNGAHTVAEFPNFFLSQKSLLTWDGEDVYLKVPVRDGYSVKVEYLNLFNLITDGTNRAYIPFDRWVQHWDIDKGWKDATSSMSLHPDVYSVFKHTMTDDVAFRVIYTKNNVRLDSITLGADNPDAELWYYDGTLIPTREVERGDRFNLGQTYRLVYIPFRGTDVTAVSLKLDYEAATAGLINTAASKTFNGVLTGGFFNNSGTAFIIDVTIPTDASINDLTNWVKFTVTETPAVDVPVPPAPIVAAGNLVITGWDNTAVLAYTDAVNDFIAGVTFEGTAITNVAPGDGVTIPLADFATDGIVVGDEITVTFQLTSPVALVSVNTYVGGSLTGTVAATAGLPGNPQTYTFTYTIVEGANNAIVIIVE